MSKVRKKKKEKHRVHLDGNVTANCVRLFEFVTAANARLRFVFLIFARYPFRIDVGFLLSIGR